MLAGVPRFSVAQNELLSLTKVSRGLGNLLDEIKKKTLEKIVILKNNEAEAVILPLDEYIRLKNIAETAELLNIHGEISSRMETPKEEYVDMDEMFERVDKDRA